MARAYDRAFVAHDERALCTLMTSSLRNELTTAGGTGPHTTCPEAVAFADGAIRDVAALRPVVTVVRISGARASVTVRANAGIGVLPLAREAGRWRVAGPVRYLSRLWLQADYRIRNAGGQSTASIASIVAERGRTLIGTFAQARVIGRDEVRLSVAGPVRLADLSLVIRRDGGRLALYDWEADALTPAGKPVNQGLRQNDGAAQLISQGSETEPPGSAGGMPLRDAMKLAAAQRRSRAEVVAGEHPGARYYVLRDRAALSRSDLTGAYASFDPLGRPEIVLEFTPRGARAFQALTARISRRGAMLSRPMLTVNQHIAAVLDGKLLSVIYVDFNRYPDGIPSADGTQITGFSPTTAQQLAAEIAAPPLPADLQLVGSATIARREVRSR